MKCRLAAFALALAVAHGAESQVSGHQRLGVVTAALNRLEAGVDCSWEASDKAWVADCDAGVEYEWGRSLGFGLGMPWVISFSSDEEGSRWAFSWGDPSASVSIQWRGEQLRIGAGLDYTFPLDRKADRGFHRFAPSLSVAIVRDPVVLACSASLATCLPREEGGYLLWPALSGSLGLSYWELLNDRISYRFGIEPGFSLGIMRVGLDSRVEPRWRLGLSMAVAWDERKWGAQVGWSEDPSAASGKVGARGCLREEW